MLPGVLKETNRLRRAVVILVVVCRAGVSGCRMLMVVVVMINS